MNQEQMEQTVRSVRSDNIRYRRKIEQLQKINETLEMEKKGLLQQITEMSIKLNELKAKNLYSKKE